MRIPNTALVALLIAPWVAVSGQTRPQPGGRIRITTIGRRQFDGVFVAVARDTVHVAPGNGAPPLLVPLDSVRELAIWDASFVRAHHDRLTGAAIGAVGGIATGLIFPAKSCFIQVGTASCPPAYGMSAAGDGIVGMLGGLLTGAVVHEFRAVDHWRPVSVH